MIASVIACGMLIGCGDSSSKTNAPSPTKSTDTSKENTDKAKEGTDKSKENTDKTKENTDATTTNNNQQVIQVPLNEELVIMYNCQFFILVCLI